MITEVLTFYSVIDNQVLHIYQDGAVEVGDSHRAGVTAVPVKGSFFSIPR
ncbi:MAG: hypothetical protein JSU61_03815 [Fidelibacterota bacterium]|nr:MAG: hypothetical protein JSU61_03815 [Candidatus Neomarinimicrobiota bacterium]